MAAGAVQREIWGTSPDKLSPTLRRALRDVQLVAFDFDGVMTDNRVYVNEKGEESVACSRFDGLGLSRLRALGIPACIVSTEVNSVVARRAEKLKTDVTHGVEDKVVAVREYAARHGVSLEHTVFVGNDINDLPALRAVGIPIVVADAHPSVVGAASYVTERRGGQGAVREVCDIIAEIIGGRDEGEALAAGEIEKSET
jgi:3-deoxy-D-manno-octulosonate 8-phosphate phosphatase (KDO 8-P phosphatase)